MTREEQADKYARKEWPYWTGSPQFKHCKTDFLAGWDARDEEVKTHYESVYGNKIDLQQKEIKRLTEINESWNEKIQQLQQRVKELEELLHRALNCADYAHQQTVVEIKNEWKALNPKQ